MIGDGDVFEAARLRGRDHRLEALAAVGLGRVHVQIALEVGTRDQLRQRVGSAAASISPRFSRSSGSM